MITAASVAEGPGEWQRDISILDHHALAHDRSIADIREIASLQRFPEGLIRCSSKVPADDGHAEHVYVEAAGRIL